VRYARLEKLGKRCLRCASLRGIGSEGVMFFRILIYGIKSICQKKQVDYSYILMRNSAQI